MCSDSYGGALITPSPSDDVAEMARLGSVGYVDPYRGLQTVPAAKVTYGAYNKLYNVRVTGTNMQTCRPTLNYGDGILVADGAKAVLKMPNGAVSFQSAGTTFLLRPPPGKDRQGPIRYGDSVVLTTSITSRNSCGVYGCEVGSVQKNKFVVGPGGLTGGTPITLEAPDGYSGTIYYGGPVVLSARVPPTGREMQVGERLGKGQSLVSPSGTYRLVYNNDGTMGVYGADQRVIWTTGKPHNAGALMLYSTALVALGRYGWPQYQIQFRGQGPFKMSVSEKGSLEVRSGETVVFSSPPDPQPGLPAEVPLLFGKVVGGQLVFGQQEGTRFTLDSQPGKKCDLLEVSKLCGDKCPGFLYSSADNTWQPLTSKASDYTKTDTMNYVVMKSVSAKLDGLCPSGEALAVTDFGTPTGVLDKCGPLEKSGVLPKAYENADKNAAAAAVALDEAVKKTKPKVKELQEVGDATVNPTVVQQEKDWKVVNDQFRARMVVWLVVAVVGVGAVVVIRRKSKGV
jgi:hypothetical protein